MNAPARLLLLRRTAVSGAFALFFACICIAPAASAQTFAAGVGGNLMNDHSSAGSPSSFSKGGVFAFGEMRIEKGTLVQLRVQRFHLPGAEADALAIRVDGATVTLAYLFQEAWFEAGFFGGGGIYRVVPDEPGAGQVAADLRENSWGLTGGVLTVVHVYGNLDLRLEGGVTYVVATSSHSPIVLGAALSYRF